MCTTNDNDYHDGRYVGGYMVPMLLECNPADTTQV